VLICDVSLKSSARAKLTSTIQNHQLSIVNQSREARHHENLTHLHRVSLFKDSRRALGWELHPVSVARAAEWLQNGLAKRRPAGTLPV